MLMMNLMMNKCSNRAAYAKNFYGKFCLSIASMALFCAAQASAQSTDNSDAIPYVVKSGDTLINISNKYVRREISYQLIQKYNGIGNEKHLRIGSTIFLPRQYLRFQSSDAEILSLRGDITIAKKDGSQTQYKVGDTISEGAVINTGRSSFMSLSLEDGSQISLPSNSNVTLRRMRRYLLERAIDYDFDITKGGSRTKVAPLRGGNDRFQVRTPKAISAVRGTEFQMRVDADNDNAIAEVVEGKLAVSNIITSNEASLPAGNGLAVTQSGQEIQEVLLPAPKLVEASATQKDDQLNFKILPTSGASKYRISLAADAGFVEQFADQTIEGTDVILPSIDNGRYFLRASALSANGIEGLYNIYSFKRRLNSVSAQGGATEDGFVFKWSARGEGKKNFHFQLFASDDEGNPLKNIAIVDEAGLNQDNIIISDISQGVYVWRLGTILFDNGEVDTSWTEYQKLIVGPE